MKRSKGKMIKTRTVLYLLMMLMLLLVTIRLYFSLYSQISKTAYEKEEQNIEVFMNQIEGTLDLICNSVNTDLSRFAENQNVQDFFQSEGIFSVGRYNQVRNEIMNTIAFNSYNSFVQMSLYTEEKCIYPENGKEIQEILTEEELKKVNEYNGNTVWLRKNDKKNQFLVAKKVLLSSYSFQNGGYILAYINSNILDFIQSDFASMKEVRIVLSNEFGEIAVKESKRNMKTSEKILIFERELPVSHFRLSFEIPDSVFLEGIADMQKIVLHSILTAAALFLILAYVISVFVTNPFKDLIEMMKMSEGRLVTNEKRYLNYEANQFNEYYNQLVKKNQELIRDIYEKDIQMLQTQLEMLQTQINPHFLYNTLESVYLTLEAKGEQESAQIVYMLSKLFKYALKANKTIIISKEIEMVHIYLEIEKYRFGKRFDWKITVDDATENIKVPKLLLQPLVENAVKHGIEPSEYGGTIQISITTYETILIILVRDNGVGMTSEEKKELCSRIQEDTDRQSELRSSIGLRNVYRRLVNYYGTDARMDIESEKGEYTEVTIVIHDYKKMGEYANEISDCDSR